jgi:hypothetical protein
VSERVYSHASVLAEWHAVYTTYLAGLLSEDDGGRVAVLIYENGYGYDHAHNPVSESCDSGEGRTC